MQSHIIYEFCTSAKGTWPSRFWCTTGASKKTIFLHRCLAGAWPLVQIAPNRAPGSWPLALQLAPKINFYSLTSQSRVRGKTRPKKNFTSEVTIPLKGRNDKQKLQKSYKNAARNYKKATEKREKITKNDTGRSDKKNYKNAARNNKKNYRKAKENYKKLQRMCRPRA